MSETNTRNRKITTFVGIVVLCIVASIFLFSMINSDFAVSFAKSFTFFIKFFFPAIPTEFLSLIDLIGVFLFMAVLAVLVLIGLVLVSHDSQRPPKYTWEGRSKHERLKDAVYESLFDKGYNVEYMRPGELKDKLHEAEHLVADMSDEELREEVKKSIDELEEEEEEIEEEEEGEEW